MASVASSASAYLFLGYVRGMASSYYNWVARTLRAQGISRGFAVAGSAGDRYVMVYPDSQWPTIIKAYLSCAVSVNEHAAEEMALEREAEAISDRGGFAGWLLYISSWLDRAAGRVDPLAALTFTNLSTVMRLRQRLADAMRRLESSGVHFVPVPVTDQEALELEYAAGYVIRFLLDGPDSEVVRRAADAA